MSWCEERGIPTEQLVRAFIGFCEEPENTDVLRVWIRQEIAQDKIYIEKLPSVTREEVEQNVDAVLARAEAGESPILIRNVGKGV